MVDFKEKLEDTKGVNTDNVMTKRTWTDNDSHNTAQTTESNTNRTKNREWKKSLRIPNRIRKSKDRQHNGQKKKGRKDKHRSTKRYT